MGTTQGPAGSSAWEPGSAMGHRRLALDGQEESEGGAPVGPFLRPDATAVRFHDRAANGQAQPGALRLRIGTAIELLEDTALVPRGQPRAVIGYLDHGTAIVGPGPHIDLGAGRSVLGRVFEEVDENLLDEH